MPHSNVRTLVLACLCAFIAFVHPVAARDASKPNIIFLLADDLGFGDLHCYGHPYSRTPNLDKLAGDGTRFLQFHATGCTCCPARTGFMTSKFPATYPTYPANGGFANHITITELLKKEGYTTGHFGKWHIGPVQKSGTYGIDSIGSDEEKVRNRMDPRGRDAPIYDQAIHFIEENKDHPFYMNVWGHATHQPVNPPQALVDKWTQTKLKDEDFSETMQQKIALYRAAGADVSDAMRRYLADVEAMDEDVGRLLQKLDELGLRDNTIVVFSSDQGSPNIVKQPADGGVPKVIDRKASRQRKRGKTPTPADATPPDPSSDVSQNVRFNLMGYNGDHRGGKHTNWEGGVCVPFIIRWPGHAPAGRVDESSVISGIDWLPSLCHIVGAPIDAADFDGEDVSAAWLGGTHTRTKPLFWKTSTPGSEAAIRDGQWKLFSPSGRRGEIELYDIPADSFEKNNVAAAHPDIVKILKAKVDAWRDALPKTYLKTGDKQD